MFTADPATGNRSILSIDACGVSRMVDGDAGARLFALSSTSPDLPINRVQINGPSDFAIAQVRYQLEAQEIDPALVLFIILVLILIIALLLFL